VDGLLGQLREDSTYTTVSFRAALLGEGGGRR